MKKKLSDIFSKKPKINPKIYAFKDSHPDYKGLLKVGYTTVDVLSRVKQQYGTIRPGSQPWKIELEESAMLPSGSNFTDKDVHRYLRKRGFLNPDGENNLIVFSFRRYASSSFAQTPSLSIFGGSLSVSPS